MANIGALANLNDAVEQFSKEAERVEKAKINIWDIFRVYWGILWLRWHGKKLLKSFRLLMSLCEQLCTEAGCLQKHYPNIKRIRDKYALIYQVSLRYISLSPLRFSLDKTLDDWDDLLEDCSIAKDPEIRELINQIADAI